MIGAIVILTFAAALGALGFFYGLRKGIESGVRAGFRFGSRMARAKGACRTPVKLDVNVDWQLLLTALNGAGFDVVKRPVAAPGQALH